jgi:hypothetical protein
MDPIPHVSKNITKQKSKPEPEQEIDITARCETCFLLVCVIYRGRGAVGEDRMAPNEVYTVHRPHHATGGDCGLVVYNQQVFQAYILPLRGLMATLAHDTLLRTKVAVTFPLGRGVDRAQQQ